MMVRTTSDPRVVAGQAGGPGGKARNAELPPGAPVHVSHRAQAVPLDLNIIRQFDFSQNIDRSVIPERPNTSGGPVAKSSLRGDAGKRETRDDLYFDTSIDKATTYYDFPLPGSLPTPTGSPKESTLPPRISSLPRSFTPESMEGGQDMKVAQMEIGMAIGSPSHPPISWQQPLQQYYDMRNDTPETLREYVEDYASSTATPPPVKLKSKWKMFGGLFGGSKKHTHPLAQNFYQLQEEGQRMEPDVTQVRNEEPRDQMKDLRGRTNSERKTGKKKPDVKRANTAPNQVWQDSASRNGNPEILLDGNQIDDNFAQKGSGGLMLNVDIPSVEMERYSVMFGSLLSKQGNSNPNLSLLDRRQATLDRLRSTSRELAIKEQELEEKSLALRQPRRATSPQPTRSPAFSLFPNTPSRESRTGRTPSPNGRTTLHRSNTSPAVLSPSRPTFAPGLDNEVHATLMEPGPHIPSGYESEDHAEISASTATGSNPVKKRPDFGSVVKAAQAAARVPPQLITRTFTPDQSHLTLSPDSDEFLPTPLPMKPVLTEPAWQMVAKPTHTRARELMTGPVNSQSDHNTTASSPSASTSNNTAPHSKTPSIGKSSLEKSPMASSAVSKLNQPPAPRSRSRSATTSAQTPSGLPRPSFSRRNPTEIPNSSVAHSAIIPAPTNPSSTNNTDQPKQSTLANKLSQQTQIQDAVEEEHLKSLVDVSIARQISVSRQQRQLLVPIRSRTMPNPTTERARLATTSNTSPQNQIHDQNFPSPLQSLKNRNVLGAAHVTSPLSAVERLASKEKEKREKAQLSGGRDTTVTAPKGNKVPGIIIKGTEKRERRERERERLMEGVKPSTPTLVFVDGSNDSGEMWSGNMVAQREQPQQTKTSKVSIAERRRKAREERNANNFISGHGNGDRTERSFLGDRRVHENRKSERVIIEG